MFDGLTAGSAFVYLIIITLRETNDVSMSRVTRREWLAQVGLTAGAAVVTASGLSSRVRAATPLAESAQGRRRALRVAHLTDIHIQPERAAAKGFAACLHHVQSQPDQPDVIFTGGDSIFDALAQDRARTQLQWDLWRRVLKGDCSLPVASAVGNHDIWGWNRKGSGTSGDEGRWGKRWATDALGLDRSYHSFDRAGWHFVFLDSVLPESDPETRAVYKAGLDDEQFDWLTRDLADTAPATPVMIVSHIPIYSVAALHQNLKDDTGAARIPKVAMHTDYKRLKDLFRRHRNVKLAVSGHLHQCERIDYAGMTYLCNGAVSGGWWKGPHLGDECDAGYAMLNLYDDGTFEHEYVHYGWTYQPAPV